MGYPRKLNDVMWLKAKKNGWESIPECTDFYPVYWVTGGSEVGRWRKVGGGGGEILHQLLKSLLAPALCLSFTSYSDLGGFQTCWTSTTLTCHHRSLTASSPSMTSKRTGVSATASFSATSWSPCDPRTQVLSPQEGSCSPLKCL